MGNVALDVIKRLKEFVRGALSQMDIVHNLCLEKLKSLGFKRKEDDWCFERYNCPRFTTPDEEGNVILDYGISIEE